MARGTHPILIVVHLNDWMILGRFRLDRNTSENHPPLPPTTIIPMHAERHFPGARGQAELPSVDLMPFVAVFSMMLQD
ncbi:hypothetical protein COCNU_02G018600 [Cocos nucifera]|uniref:Uncharacterized protein n=1 Tax=Cocos nucifera TaxID=13894 RepID=A0A8K0I1I1_COCNU|nr:hypothetical protein COCNU_02G018600 [Cocos nucifera]